MKEVTHFFKAIGLAVLLFLEFCFLYSGRFNHLFYSDAGTIVVVALVLLVIPATITFFFREVFAKNDGLKFAGWAIGMLSIITNGPFFGYWCGKQEEAIYKKQGVHTWGTVMDVFHGGDRMYYQFSANGTYYTSANVHNPSGYAEGDSIEIVYNPKCPEMNTAVDELDE